MGVDGYQTYQTSRTTFSAALTAAPSRYLLETRHCPSVKCQPSYPSRCRPKKNQMIPTIRYRPSVQCRLFTGCRTLLSAAPSLIAQYDQYRLVPGGNVIHSVMCCRTYADCRVPPLFGAAPGPEPRVAPDIFARVRRW